MDAEFELTPQQDFAPDIERCACTMLGQHLKDGHLRNETVISFVERVIGDPAEIDIETMTAVREKAIRELDESANTTYDEDRITIRSLIYSELVDRAALKLARSVAFYRAHGRPAGDRVVKLGFGFGVTTSLAAAVVEFHFEVVRAWHTADQLAKMEAR